MMKAYDFLITGCAAVMLTLFVSAETPSIDYSDAELATQIQKLGAPGGVDRKSAMQFMETWAASQPDKAKQQFLSLFRDSQEPEVRERSLKLLKIIAASEYGKFGQGYIGVTMGMETQVVLPGEGKPCFGIPITWVTKNSPAEKGGMQPGDVIVSIDNMRWHQPLMIGNLEQGLSAKIRAKGAGNKAVFGIWKNDKLTSLEIELSRRPPNLENMAIMRIIPNGGGLQVDPAELSKLVDEDKASDDYFTEWLGKQFPAAAVK